MLTITRDFNLFYVGWIIIKNHTFVSYISILSIQKFLLKVDGFIF